MATHIPDLSFTDQDLLQMAKEFGTPLYVYDAKKNASLVPKIKISLWASA